MRRNLKIADINQRLQLFERYFEFARNSDWLELLGYGDEASVSRVKNGKQGISDRAVAKICDASGISRNDFVLPLWELAELLEVADGLNTDTLLSTLSSSASDTTDDIHSYDRATLKQISGDYILLYPGREEKHISHRQIVVEKFRVRGAVDGNKCDITQLSNFITGERASGELVCRGSTVSINIVYRKSYFPDSHYLLQPILMDDGLKILSGIYLDVAPLAHIQVFATQCVMFSVDDIASYPRRYPMDTKTYALWSEILDNRTESRGRLISRSGDEFYEKVRFAVLRTQEEGELR